MDTRGNDQGGKGTVWFVVAVEKDLLHPGSRGQGRDMPAAGPRVSYTLQTGTLALSPHKLGWHVGIICLLQSSMHTYMRNHPLSPCL